MALHVIYVGKPGPYLIGDDQSPDPLMVRIFRPTAGGKGSLSDTVSIHSILSQMPGVSFEEYHGPPEEERAILAKVAELLKAQQSPPTETADVIQSVAGKGRE